VLRSLRVVGVLALAVTAMVLMSGGAVPARVLVDPPASSQTTVVPRVTGGVVGAYRRLRAAGLRVSIPRGLSFDSLRPPMTTRTSPAGGRRVARDSVVTVYLSCCGRARRSRVATGRLHRFAVPNFAGGVASSAYTWASTHGLDFRAHLGPLTAGAESGLFANYRVSSQQPAAGARLAVGHRSPTASGEARRFQVTVWGSQPPPCTPLPGDTVVARSSEAVVTSRLHPDPVYPEIAWYGCLRTVGEWRLLTAGGNGGSGETLTAHQVLLAGRFVAFSFQDALPTGSECADSVAIFDLSSAEPGSVFCGPPGGSAVDSLTLDANGFAAWHTTEDLPPIRLTGMSCPSVSLCVAIDSAGRMLATTSPTGGQGAWTVAGLAGGSLYGISCPTVNLCVATGGEDIYTSANPARSGAAWSVTHINGVTGLGAVSCPSTSLCVATAGTVGGGVAVVTSTDPTGGGATWSSIPIPNASGELQAISCPSASLCVAGGVPSPSKPTTILVSTDPHGGASAWTSTKGIVNGAITSVSCPSRNLCVAGTGPLGIVLSSTHPTGGASAWTATQLPFAGAMPAISCPATTLCVAGSYSATMLT
jgi:hypothetical protein